MFARGQTEIAELKVTEGSKLCNGTTSAPRGDFILREGDRVFFTALSRNLTTLLNNPDTLTHRVRHITICEGQGFTMHLLRAESPGPAVGKPVFSWAMLAGRLEIFPMLVLFSRNIWRNR